MNKLIISFIIAFVLLTTIISAAKPKLHKPLTFAPQSTVVEDIPEKTSEEEVQAPQVVHVQQEETEETKFQFFPQKDNIIEQNVKVKPENTQTVQQRTIVQNQPSQMQNREIKTGGVKNQTQTTQKTKYELPKSVQDIVNGKKSPAQQEERIVKTQPAPVQKQVQQKTAAQPIQQQARPVQTKPQQVQQKTVQVTSNTPLTEAEEVIVWNKWRSDLQNKVMRDSRIAAPRGTVFRFSFTVNKFGQMSNLKVWSDTPGYTNYAIQALKPLILSYQGQPILNFPARTKRITTNVEGAFAISNQDRYTTPNDYSDIERVRN